jgi:hypothetical protein
MSFPIRKPTSASQLGMLGLEQVTWPVTYTYLIDTPWGETQQQLTVDAPALVDQMTPTKALGRLLWGSFAAPAAVGDVSMYACLLTTWKAYAGPVVAPGPELRGNLFGSASPRGETPQAVMMTGHNDDDGRRRLFFAGAPNNWAENGLLTMAGWEGLWPHCVGLTTGLMSPGLSAGLEWLLAYPDRLESSLTNLPGVAFRKVTHLRICWHTDKAPEPSGIPDV